MIITIKPLRFYVRTTFITGSYSYECLLTSNEALALAAQHRAMPNVRRVVIYPIVDFRKEAPRYE